MRKFLSNSFLYFSTNFLSKAVSLFLLPLFTSPKYLSPSGYGQILLFASMSLLLNPLIIFGGLDRIAIHYYDKEIDRSRIKRESNTIALVFFLVTTVLFFAFSPVLTSALDVSYDVLLVLPLSAFLNYYSEQLLITLRFRGNARSYFLTFLVKILLDAGVTILCLVVFHWGWYGRLAGIFAGLLFSFFIALRIDGISSFSMPFGKLHLKKIIAQSFPFVLIQFFLIGLTNLDKVIISQALPKEELAIYGIAFQLCYLLPTATNTLMTVSQPLVYKILSEPAIPQYHKLQKLLLACFGVVAITAVGIYLAIPLFYHFIKDRHYHDGIYLVKYLLIAWTFWCFGSLLADIVKKLGTRTQMIITYLVPFVVFLATVYTSSRHFGLKGVAVSLILSYGCLLGMIIFFSTKQLRLAMQKQPGQSATALLL